MADLIAFILSNFTLTFFVIGLVAAAIALPRQPRPRPAAGVVEAVLAWFLFFSIGVSFLYNFVFHVFFGDLAAAFIGWENSPFQAEVGYASLGFAAVGFLAFRGGRRGPARRDPRAGALPLGRGGRPRRSTWSARTTSRRATPGSSSGPTSSCRSSASRCWRSPPPRR